MDFIFKHKRNYYSDIKRYIFEFGLSIQPSCKIYHSRYIPVSDRNSLTLYHVCQITLIISFLPHYIHVHVTSMAKLYNYKIYIVFWNTECNVFYDHKIIT